MKKKQTFWADAQLSEKLSTIPRNEKSTIIRMALRQYFGISTDQIVADDDARLVAKRPRPKEEQIKKPRHLGGHRGSVLKSRI